MVLNATRPQFEIDATQRDPQGREIIVRYSGQIVTSDIFILFLSIIQTLMGG